MGFDTGFQWFIMKTDTPQVACPPFHCVADLHADQASLAIVVMSMLGLKQEGQGVLTYEFSIDDDVPQDH